MTWTPLPGAGLERVRARGRAAVAALAFASVAGFPIAWFLTPPLVSVLIGMLFVAVAVLVGQEIRGSAADPIPVRPHRFMFVGAVIGAIPAGLVSLFCESWASTPDPCLPLPSPTDAYTPPPPHICFITTHAQNLALISWIAVMALMVAVLIVGVVSNRRSQIVSWAAFPVVFAAATVAFDVSHAVALTVGKNSP